ncbi:hypothetical protein LAZ67_11000472 [Cordylochernes scorpioides]|uniref:GIY-YIG domain-containing protein n=1 Tax=Cordylochernes scorpioides TaxID=51811 RepID=A0ABY6KYK2_9ARAC|nr:hypothetical protein LAZ67_11000472 [Cordylochernes scorpioides]
MIHKRQVIKSLVQRAKQVCTDRDIYKKEIMKIRAELEQSDYPVGFTNKWIRRYEIDRPNSNRNKDDCNNIIIPYLRDIDNEISRILRKFKYNIWYSTGTKREFLTRNRIMKDNIGTLKPSNVIYGIKCTQCDKIYVGETGRNLETRIKEHQQGLMGRRALSKIGEHALYSGHRPDWNDIEIFHRNIKFKKERLFLEGRRLAVVKRFTLALSDMKCPLHITTDAHHARLWFHFKAEFDRGIIVAYRDFGYLSGKSEGTTDRRVRSHPPQCTTSRADSRIVSMAVTDRSVTLRTVPQHIQSVTHHPVSARTIRRRLQQSDVYAANGAMKEGCGQQNEIVFTDESRFCLQHHDGRIRVWRHRGERMLNSCVLHRHTGPAPGIMVWGGIGYHSRTPLVRIAGTLNSQRYISKGFPTAIFQQDNARPHVTRIVQRFFVNRQIELLPWPARSPDLSPIENMWSMIAQRLTQITSPAATQDQL